MCKNKNSGMFILIFVLYDMQILVSFFLELFCYAREHPTGAWEPKGCFDTFF